MSKRKTYKVEVTVSIQVDDERLAGVERIVQEHVNVLYHRMERDDIRVVLQHQCKVTETP